MTTNRSIRERSEFYNSFTDLDGSKMTIISYQDQSSIGTGRTDGRPGSAIAV